MAKQKETLNEEQKPKRVRRVRKAKVAEQPPRRATATEAPTFMVLGNRAQKNRRSRAAVRVELAEA